MVNIPDIWYQSSSVCVVNCCTITDKITALRSGGLKRATQGVSSEQTDERQIVSIRAALRYCTESSLKCQY